MIDIRRLKEHMFDVLGAIYTVHKELGPGLNEYCYQEGLQMELTEQKIPFLREMSFHPSYRGKQMESLFRIDFLCKGNIIIECKAVPKLQGDHRAQLFNYMRLLKKECGILVNFHAQYACIERYLFDSERNIIIGMNGQIMQSTN